MKMNYTTPWIKWTQVETEGTFAGSVVDNKGKGVTIEAASQPYEVVDGNAWETGIGGDEKPNVEWN